MTDPTVAAAILAGGRARRFSGRDKSRLVIEGRTIIVRQVDVLQRVAGEVFVVGPDPSRFADLALDVHPDRRPGAGALGGIETALEVATADRVLVLACDMPFLHEGVLRRLVSLADTADGAWVHSTRGVEPLLACYRRHARTAVSAALDRGQRKAADLGQVLRIHEIGDAELAVFGDPDRLLANLNSADDYTKVE